jgi:hypothetical protein
MRVISRLGRAFWIGLLLIGLAVLAWFVAPQAHSCPIDVALEDCDSTWVVVLNVAGLILFMVGGGLLFLAAGLARSRSRQQGSAGSGDTR